MPKRAGVCGHATMGDMKAITASHASGPEVMTLADAPDGALLIVKDRDLSDIYQASKDS